MEPLAFSLQIVQNWFEAGGYFVLFGLLFACGLGLPLPEDIPLTLAGFFIAKGQMNLAIAAICAWCGIIGGDLVLYQFGKKFGLEITRVPFIGKHVTRARIERAEILFDRYGIWVVAIGRLFAGIRGAMVIAAGATRYSLLKFLLADGLAAIVSGGLFIALGHWVGVTFGSLDKIDKIRKRIAHIEHYALAIALVLIILAVLYFLWRRKRHTTLSEVALEKAADRATHPPHDPH